MKYTTHDKIGWLMALVMLGWFVCFFWYLYSYCPQ